MDDIKKKLDAGTLTEQLSVVLVKLKQYRLILFLLFVAAIYGFVFLRINTLNNAQPSSDAVAAQNNPIQASHIDKTVVKQLESLRDNSVNVQTLFEQARNNPFQE
jgi:hypothetical protein